MIDRIKMFLNCNQELQEKIKIFIEYFVKYYGEDRREKTICGSRISEKIKNSFETREKYIEYERTWHIVRKLHRKSMQKEVL